MKISMKERCRQIAEKYTPAGTKIEYRKSLTGRAWPEKGFMKTPKPTTLKSTYIYLHEVAHLKLHSKAARGKSKPSYLKEYEAEKQVHDWFAAEGLDVPKEMTVRARQYVARKILTAIRVGAREIDQAAMEFSLLPADKVERVRVESERRRVDKKLVPEDRRNK